MKMFQSSIYYALSYPANRLPARAEKNSASEASGSRSVNPRGCALDYTRLTRPTPTGSLSAGYNSTISFYSLFCLPEGGGHSLIWAIRGRAAGQGMVFWPRCPKQGIQFDLPQS